ncbi:MAG: leucine-rich repeat domain-containing protein [Bacteroidales bacterium]|nr:leucine-rich repeat domain-containing protein [Bacteroidales bacterium]
MKNNFHLFWLTALMMLFNQSLSAHNFEVDGIYYKYLSRTDKTVEVSFKGNSFSFQSYINDYSSGKVVIPESVTYDGTIYTVASIGNYAFYSCAELTGVEIPNSVTSIDSRAFWNCTRLTAVEIPNSVTSIGDFAFYGCTGLTSIEIPNSVTLIGNHAFRGCTGLTSIEIPNNVTRIGAYAFYECTNLRNIEIPTSVTSISVYAFYGCTGLTNVTVLSSTPVSISSSSGVFQNSPISNATLYVPKGSKAAYEAADYWKEFKEIVEIEVGTEEKYNVTIPEFVFGKVTSDKVQAAAGEVVTFTAEPNTGYYLSELKVQKHTSGEHAQAPSVRSTNVSSAETVTMTYNASTGSYTGTYTMPACDVTIAQANFVAKTKQTIVAQDVTCTLGDTELSVSATNQTQGGGALTYAVSEGNDVVRVDAESGALTILKAGMATVTVTAAEMEKYLETAVSVKVTVLNTITAQADDVTLPYDGAAHGIQVNVSAPTTGYTVTYGTEAGHYTLTTSPTQTVVGSLTVYYKVSAAGYTDLEGSAKVTIVKADIAAGNYDTPQSTVVTGEGIAYTGGEQALVSGGTTNEGTTYYRVNGGEWSTEMPSATEPGTYAIEWYVAGDANHNDMGSETAPAGTLTVTILDVKEVAIVQELATFYNGASAYRIPDNAKAWTGTVDYANGCVNMSEVTGGIIPAGTAVVLTSDEEKVSLVQSLSEASAIESDLHGTDTYIGGALTGDENIYVLHNGEFVWATSGTLASGKAYLVYDPNLAPSHAAAMRLWLNFDEVTSIASLEASAEKSTYYDLQGTQVVAPRSNALYIRNGKKVMVK